MIRGQQLVRACLQCGNPTSRQRYTYCSNACQIEYQHETFIAKWKAGEVVGLQNIGVVSDHIKRYLRKKYENKCCLCGWSQVNQKTGKVPLVADHIDGNWRNNTESNLRLLCPNCDSLSPTYTGSNKNGGRKGRVISNRVKEARLLIKKAIDAQTVETFKKP